jgi:Uma2 family endonuclease
MATPPGNPPVSIEEYLSTEQHSLVRHEYVNGQLFGITGSSAAHNLIALNLYVMLRTHTKGSTNAVFVSDMKVKIDATNAFYYPDVVVTNCRPEPTSLFVSDPVLIIEVQSTSPEAGIDAHAKIPAYSGIATLQEYVIVQPDRQFAELRTRDGSNWTVTRIDAGMELVLNSLATGPFRTRLEAIYDEVGVD